MSEYNAVNNSELNSKVYEGGNPPLSTAFPNYPEANMETMFGPVLLPKIYAKGLSALEIASSGDIILSINDFETLNISNDETTRETIFQSTSNYHLKFYPNDAEKTVQVADHTWTSENINGVDYQVMRTSQSGGYMLSNDLIVTGQLDLSGDTAFSGDVSFGGRLSIQETVFMSSGLSVLGNMQMEGTLSVNNDVILGSQLSVNGATVLADTLSVANNVFLSSDLSVQGNTEIVGRLSVKDDVFMSSNLSVLGNTEMNGTLSVKDSVILSSDLSVHGNTEIEGELSVSQDVILSSGLSVSGETVLADTLSVASDVLLSSDLSVHGNTTMVGKLSVNDRVIFKSTLSVNDTTTLGNMLSVAGDVYMSSDLSVAQNAYFMGPVFKVPDGPELNRPLSNVAPVGSLYFNSNTMRFEGLHNLGNGQQEWLPFGGVMDIDADTYITAEKEDDNDTLSFYADDALTPRMTMTSTLLSISLPVVMATTLSVKGVTDLEETVRMGSRLSVQGQSILNNTLSVKDKVFLSSSLSVLGNTEMNGTLSVKDKVFLTSDLSVLGNTEMNGTLSVKDKVFMTSDLSVLGNTEMNGTLSVNNGVILNSTLSVKDASVLAATLSVGGDTHLSSDLSVAGNTRMSGMLSVQNSAYLTSNLSVTGDTALKGQLSVKNGVYLSSHLSVTGSTRMIGNLSVNGDVVMQKTLSVGNELFLGSSLSIQSGTQIGGKLSVKENVYIDSTLDSALYVDTIKDYSNQDGTGTLTIDVDTLVVRGNLDVAGTYNTIDISTSSISVEDKLLILATSSNFDGQNDVDADVVDSLDTNSSAGIKIAGLPASDQLSTANIENLQTSNVWEKSLKWNINSGMPYLGYLHPDMTNDTNYRDLESFWELKGGAFHISADKVDDDGVTKTIKYGFRINANDELEIIKKIGDDASKRVAKFGITSAFT